MQKTSPKALITGITGQDGAYLAQLLLAQGYTVYGAFRRTSSVNFWRLQELGLLGHPGLHLVEYDLTDQGAAIALLHKLQPDEVYNLAAQSFVGVSFEQPATTAQITGVGALHLLEAIRLVNPKIRFYQASTSEMFGKVQAIPQSENTPFYPRSPYGVAKLYAYWITVNYREAYGLYACNGILFNHESPRRGETFVTRKITRGLAHISQGLEDCLYMGNLDALRDWGHAKDYVRMQWLMLQQTQAQDFVIATGQQYSVRQFIDWTAAELGMNLVWQGQGTDEVGLWNGRPVVRVDPRYFRPAEVESLLGDASLARERLGWVPEITAQQMCQEMVASDLAQARQSALLKRHGYPVNVGAE